MIFLLDDDPDTPFPDVSLAEREPDGLLAVGGDLTPQRLVHAYRQGIFPWFTDGEPILWWSPDPRTVLYPKQIRISRSLRKTLRKGIYQVSFDHDFEGVIQGCAAPRDKSPGTWLVPEMIKAYRQQHLMGMAHSVEVWQDDELVGGLYGMAIGGVFFGESMFSRAPDSSKVALVHLSKKLADWGFKMIDCQVYTKHLASLGAEEIPRATFCGNLERWTRLAGRPGSWSGEDTAPPGTEPC
ncbi:MAG: leucyl/phenylalanyl-tRNA--protein transferase [Candidatus Thiodiazotropha sp. (ex Dulcina madagascariensis)]|nr:leucyl/phenylalanyl-tRNA--protein transferase [Candidatus Thiodiazotropha sp. (ex Dulcina madagascariensis)]MCU7927596.1 leucyl/phenylalanyl-tRNA--protein transferase [Candidatus Thiodiazotropha sp. (ex Dulcina madagascariensis)]